MNRKRSSGILKEQDKSDQKLVHDYEIELKKCKAEISSLKKTKDEIFHKEKLISIGQLSAGIAHEINNPLAFVKGNFSALLRYFDDMKSYIALLENHVLKSDIKNIADLDKYKNEVNIIREDMDLNFIYNDIKNIENESSDGFDRIQVIISSLSEFSRFESKTIVQHYNINNALDRTLTVVWNQIKYVADIKRDYEENVDDIECINPEINQVLLNIVMNATQAIAEKNSKGKGLITLQTRSDKQTLYISISDNGPGISKNLIKHIFDPFFTTKETGKGTGLGLSISYDIIVKRHHGKIGVESTPGEGSTFKIELPLKYYKNIDNDGQDWL